jgi:Cu/Ag efflux protein CusF
MKANSQVALTIASLFLAGGVASSWLGAQESLTPCCNIVSIDANGLVSARQADGRVFQFQVADQALLASLHIGQAVWADFGAKQVTLKYGAQPCCGIRAAGPGAPVGAQQLQPAGFQPCCSITAIDRGAGTATATVKATGEAFTFTVGDKAVLASLHTGQPVWADFAANQVTLKYGLQPCCAIRAAGPGAPVGAQQLQPAGWSPCCAITAIDRGAGTATATVKATGEAFTFNVGDNALLSSLRIGQGVWADFDAKQVALKYGGQPCCQIRAAGPGAPVGVQQLQPAGIDACCAVVVNAALTGRLGRLVVAFPFSEGVNAGSTQVDVFKAGETASLQTGYGAQSLDLLPGTYSVAISGARVDGVTVQSGHDTRLRVGILRIKAGGNTRAEVLAADGKTALTGGYGVQVIGLPVGTYRVQIAGGLEAVTIQDGKITDF